MQHDLGRAAGEKDLHSGIVAGAVGERIDETWNLAIDVGPVLCCGSAELRRVGYRWHVEQQVG